MSVEQTIICDQWARVAAAAKTARQARADLRGAGGKTNLPGGRDICQHCVADNNKNGASDV